MDIQQRIGIRIKEMRVIRGLTQEELAAQLTVYTGTTVAQSAVSTWEAGTRRIYADQIFAIAQVLRCTPFSLLSDDRHSDARLNAEMSSLDHRHKETIHYAATDWPGDTMALIEATRIYMALPRKRRRQVVEYIIYEHDEAYKHGELDRTTPAPDIEYIRKKTKELR